MAHDRGYGSEMKLRQNQIWQKDENYIRIVHRDTLSVVYKPFTAATVNEKVPHQRATKKDFCRMLKGFVLIDALPDSLKPLENEEAQPVENEEALEPVLAEN